MKIYFIIIITLGFIKNVPGQSITYKYDNLNRLIQVDYPDSSTIYYSYDPAGNRLSKKIINACLLKSKLYITSSANRNLCEGDSLVLSLPYASQYTWSTGATTQSIVVHQAGKYYATANFFLNCSGRSDTIVVTVKPKPLAHINAINNTSICSGDSVTLKADSADSYKWSTGATSRSITVKTGGVYTLKVTNSNGCSDSTAITIVVKVLPPAPIVSGVINYCQNSVATFLTATAMPGNTLLWYTSATGATGLSTPPIPSTSITGISSYYVSQVTSTGCQGPRAKMDVSVIALPAAPIAGSSFSYCENSPASTLTATALAGHTLFWYTTAAGGIGLTAAPTPLTLIAGTTSYYVTQVNSTTGCESARTKIDVIVNPLPPVPAVTSPIQYCLNVVTSPLTATALSGNTLLWYNTNPGSVGSSIPPTPSSAIIGTVSYYVSQKNALTGCEGSRAKIDAVTNPLPIVNTGGDKSICYGTGINLGASRIPGNTYFWTPTTWLNNPTLSNPLANPSVTTPYSLKVVNIFGCSASGNITITVNPLPVADAGGDVVLSRGKSIILGGNPTGKGSGPMTFLWFPPEALNSNTVSNPKANPSHTITYNLRITDKNGCTDTTKVRVVVIDGEYEVTPNPTTGEVNVYKANIDDGEYTVWVSTMAGQQVLEPKKIIVRNNSLTANINLGALTRGVYMLWIYSKKSSKFYKITKIN
ncbi:MAG: T9SS type A sorting domain-containing protein [Bacteroidota bacterium]|nr:T9SS type A sorting domain-containing protein [Bacteroidota bacterium]